MSDPDRQVSPPSRRRRRPSRRHSRRARVRPPPAPAARLRSFRRASSTVLRSRRSARRRSLGRALDSEPRAVKRCRERTAGLERQKRIVVRVFFEIADRTQDRVVGGVVGALAVPGSTVFAAVLSTSESANPLTARSGLDLQGGSGSMFRFCRSRPPAPGEGFDECGLRIRPIRRLSLRAAANWASVATSGKPSGTAATMTPTAVPADSRSGVRRNKLSSPNRAPPPTVHGNARSVMRRNCD